jgi:hypothetical protein
MKKHELIKLFKTYLYRFPSEEEINYHINKNYASFEQELLNCSEKKIIEEKYVVKNKKIAMLICGHVRNAKIIDFLKKTKENIDVFVFTWDNIGHRGTIDYKPNQEIHDCCKDQIENFIQKIPHIKKYKIENLQENFEKLMPNLSGKTFFCHMVPPIFIKSQLYTIQSCYKLFEEYCLENNEQYDIVIKCRFDCDILQFSITKKMAKFLSNDHVCFVTNDGTHVHPYFPNGCMICNRLYKEEISTIHLEEHSNIICDFFVYGNTKAMKQYCNLIEKFESINESFSKANIEKLNSKKFNIEKIDKNYYVHHLDSIFHFKCCYPERMTQYEFKNLMFISSDSIICRWEGEQSCPFKNHSEHLYTKKIL